MTARHPTVNRHSLLGIFLLCLLAASASTAADVSPELLWPNGAPNARGTQPQDIPTLTRYAPAEGAGNGATMLILPGGSYAMLADHEGKGYAEWFAAHGVTAYVLNYRLGSAGYRHPVMLYDAARALRTLRARARTEGLDPARIGIIGSSAGGHLASTLLTHFDAGQPDAADPIERESSRPDLGILCYPVITMDEFTHGGSKYNLLGDNPPAELVHLLSNETQVTADTPPCFLWHTAEDNAVPVENSLQFAAALRRAGVPFELHVYEEGGHGMGLPAPNNNAPAWDEACLAWLKVRRFLDAPRSWTTTGPLVHPTADERHPIVAVKDPSVVYHDGRWHIFATTAAKTGAWAMAYFNFATWDEAAQAKPVYLEDNPSFAGYNCAPQVFYFRPQKKWYLVFQSPQPRFSTTDDLSKPATWSAPQNFFEGTPKSVVEGWLDYWVICDDTHAYLFFPDDHGRFYRSRTRLEDFPRGFDEPVVVMQEPKPGDLFEGSCVYRLKGTNQFLCLVECVGKNGPRYYRAFTADRLDGKWKPLPGADSEATPFAGNNNVVAKQGGTLWTDGISHGELLRDGCDETMTVDPQNLQLLYQGLPRGTREPNYVLLPYRLALLRPATGGTPGNTR